MRTTFTLDDDAAALAQNYAKARAPAAWSATSRSPTPTCTPPPCAPANSKPGSTRRLAATDGFERLANWPGPANLAMNSLKPTASAAHDVSLVGRPGPVAR
jgi:hypothetical protein